METANTPRPPAAKRIMKHKKALAPAEVAREVSDALGEKPGSDAVQAELTKRCERLREQGLLIEQWNLDDVEADLNWCGRSGSPTKVHQIQALVLTGGEYREYPATDEGVEELVGHLIEEHTIG